MTSGAKLVKGLCGLIIILVLVLLFTGCSPAEEPTPQPEVGCRTTFDNETGVWNITVNRAFQSSLEFDTEEEALTYCACRDRCNADRKTPAPFRGPEYPSDCSCCVAQAKSEGVCPIPKE